MEYSFIIEELYWELLLNFSSLLMFLMLLLHILMLFSIICSSNILILGPWTYRSFPRLKMGIGPAPFSEIGKKARGKN